MERTGAITVETEFGSVTYEELCLQNMFGRKEWRMSFFVDRLKYNKELTFDKLQEIYAIQPPFALLGYGPCTTLWGDFTLADECYLAEPKAIERTYEKAFKAYKNNKIFGTELAMVLNHKIWQWYEKNETIARIYDKLWKEVDAYVMENWKGENLQYYIKITD